MAPPQPLLPSTSCSVALTKARLQVADDLCDPPRSCRHSFPIISGEWGPTDMIRLKGLDQRPSDLALQRKGTHRRLHGHGRRRFLVAVSVAS